MKEQSEKRGPRFHPSINLPEIPPGKELHKFHGQPVLLTAKEDGEPMFGNSPYTERQVRELVDLDTLRQINEETKGLDSTNSNTQALVIAISERPRPNYYKNGILLNKGVTVEITNTTQTT